MELKASDLRIGNYVNQGADYGIGKIMAYQIHEFERYKNGANTAGYYAEWQPIPITPEILVKAGFKGRSDFVYKNDFGVQIKDGKFYLALRNMSGVLFDSIVEVEYLHTLQNWYHLHTKGQELTIDL